MILTITLNPSVDRRYNLIDFEKGNVHRTDQYEYTVGGKGLNVTKVIGNLNEEVFAIGLLGGHNGKFISEGLEKMNLGHQFINISDETRSCLAIISDDGSQTEILEKGPFIQRDEIEEFLLLYESLLDKVDIVCASGSIPNGLDDDIYYKLIQLANHKNKKFLLDSSGVPLKLGIEASPYLIKPNKEEIESYVGKKINSIDELINIGKSILKSGIGVIVVSLGEEGSLVLKDKDVFKVNVPNINALNPVGSGDAMIAGIAVALYRDWNFEDIIKLGAACGTANAMENETGKVDLNNVKTIMEKISIEKHS